MVNVRFIDLLYFMECTVAVKTILNNTESKVLYKLLGELSHDMKKKCSMDDEECIVLSVMHEEMRIALGQDVCE